MPEILRASSIPGVGALRRWLFWLVVVALAVNAGRLMFGRIGAATGVAERPDVVRGPFAPYTVVLRALWHRGQAAPEFQWEETHARRSDGSLVKRRTGVQASGTYIVRDIYLATGQRILTNDVTEIRNTDSMDMALINGRRPESDCLDAERVAAGRERMLDRSVVAERPVIRIKFSRWTGAYDPALGCAMLSDVTDVGPRGFMTKEPVLISAAEPDPVLFEVPTRFTEVAPSVFAGLHPSSAQAKVLDEAYAMKRRMQ